MPDRLSPTDAIWLHMEGQNTPMHAGGLSIIEGAPVDWQTIVDETNALIDALPRMRQVVRRVPFGLNRPVWVDDPAFDIAHHCYRISMPAGSTDSDVLDLSVKLLSTPLSRDRPLWQQWVIEGIGPERYATLVKMHHCLIDGMGAVDALASVYDESSPGAPAPRHEPPVTSARLVVPALKDKASDLRTAARALRAVRSAGVRKVAAGVRELGRQAPRSPLNVPVGPYRRAAAYVADMADVRVVRKAFGGTVNDVVLSVVASGVRAWYEARSLDADIDLRLSMPVSIRPEGQVGGNHLSNLIVSVPLGELVESRRLRAVTAATSHAKSGDGQEAVAGVVLAAMTLSTSVAARVGRRLARSQRQFNVSVTNVPGLATPPPPRRVAAVATMPILMANTALAVAVTSAEGKLYFGFHADHDALPDLQVIVDGTASGLAALVAEASAVPEPEGVLQQRPVQTRPAGA